MATDNIARRGIDQVVQTTLSRALVAHGLQKAQWVGDTPARRRVHHNKPLIQRGDLSRQPIPLQDTLIKTPYRLNKGYFHLQSRGGDGSPHGFPELSDHHLLGLVDLIKCATGDNQHQHYQHDERGRNAIHVTSPSLLEPLGSYRHAADPGKARQTTAAQHRTHTPVSLPGGVRASSPDRGGAASLPAPCDTLSGAS